MIKLEDAKPGARVRYVKDRIDDVPKGRGGTVVGIAGGAQMVRPTIVVKFDHVQSVRYMTRSDLALERGKV